MRARAVIMAFMVNVPLLFFISRCFKCLCFYVLDLCGIPDGERTEFTDYESLFIYFSISYMSSTFYPQYRFKASDQTYKPQKMSTSSKHILQTILVDAFSPSPIIPQIIWNHRHFRQLETFSLYYRTLLGSIGLVSILSGCCI